MQSLVGQFKYIRMQLGRRNDHVEVDGPGFVEIRSFIDESKIILIVLHILLVVARVILSRAPKFTSIHLEHDFGDSLRSNELRLDKCIHKILLQPVFYLLVLLLIQLLLLNV